MYHYKKIGVFISHIMGHYQTNVCQGIIDKALEYGYTAEIFTTLDGENLGEYGIGEESILRIPNYSDYDGILFAPDTYRLAELKEQILKTLKEQCLNPVVALSVKKGCFPAVALENNSLTEELTRHMIKVHRCRRICYLGCSSEPYFSGLREEYYKKAMEESGYRMTDFDICSCGYSREDAAAALTFFLSEGKKPDAVICYNDRLALLFMAEALANGYRIPEDIAITGCDDSTDGQNSSPSLTTVSFPVYELGAAAVELLMKLIHKEPAPFVTLVRADPVFRNSCGCCSTSDKNVLFYSQALNHHIASLESSILSSMRMSAAIQRVLDLDDGMELLEQYIREMEHCKEFYLCLYADWDTIPNHILSLTDQDSNACAASGDMLLKLAVRNKKRLPECSFRKNMLLPEHIYQSSDSSYIYTPLFFEDKEFGYIALAYEDNRIDYHFRLVHWFMNINQMLQGICEAGQTSVLVRRLEDISAKDALTGLYNRQGYLHNGALLLTNTAAPGRTVTCFLFEAVGLKTINDTCGYAEGDFVLQVIAQALLSIVRPKDICARFHGAVFRLLTVHDTPEDADQLLISVQKYLASYNRLSSRGYTISVNGSYATALAGPEFSLSDADALFARATHTGAS